LVVLSFRGTIVVRVQWDPDSKEEMFSIRISQSNQTPVIENPTAYKKKLEWLGQRKRRFEAWQVERSTTFRGIPKGTYFVHLYGIYTRGRQVLTLSEPHEAVEVFPRKTAFVAFNLEASEAEFKITVVDDSGPVEGARVWLDQDRAKAAATPKQGNVTLKVPKGYHIIHVSAKGMQVERPYQVIKAKIHEMTINLVWERRQEHISRALERQVDDALPYLTVSHKPQAPSGSPPATHAARTAVGSGDAIEIPAANREPAGPLLGSIQGPLGRPSQVSRAPAAPRPSPTSPHAAATAGRMTLRPLAPQAAAPSGVSEPPLDLDAPVDLEPSPASLGTPVDLATPSDLDRPVDLALPSKPRRTR
jgi:hypothetical protein